MKVTVEKQAKSEVKVTIELEAAEMANYEKQAVDDLQDKVKVDGFRAGKIPKDVLIQRIGEQAFAGHVADLAVTETYEKALMQEKVVPVAYPKLQILEQNPLKYEAVVATLPEVKWKKDISKLSVKAEKLEIDKKEVEQVLENLQKRSIEWSDVDRAAKKGDRTELDFEGFDLDGNALDGTSSKNHPVVLGEGGLIPGFEEEVEGMKKGEEKDFEITFPKDYHAEHFKGKKVKFHVKVNRVEEGKPKELNDAFADEITGGNRKTLAELKEEIESELMKQKEREAQGKRENEFLKELKAYVDADVPEAMVEREIDIMIERMKEDLKRQNRTWEDYEKEMADKKKDVRAELKSTAADQVLIRLGLEKLFDEKPQEVSDKEIEEEVEMLTAMYPAEIRPMLADRYKPGSEGRSMITRQIQLRKLVDAHCK